MSQASLRTGDLRRRITLQSRSAPVDSYGQQSVAWSNYLQCWADVEPVSGREMLAAQAQQFEVTHQITIRWRDGITPAMRVLYQGRVYDVQSVIDVGMQHRRLALMCLEGALNTPIASTSTPSLVFNVTNNSQYVALISVGGI